MALQLISGNSFPTYLALSTDISGSVIKGASLIGKTIYTTDDEKWYIITGEYLTSSSGLKIVDFKLPI